MRFYSPHICFIMSKIEMPSRTNPMLAQQHQRVSVRAPCNHGTQQRHSMNESEVALFEHSHKGTRPYYQSGSSPIPGKLTPPSRTAVSCSGWHCSSLRKTVLDDFPRGIVKMSLSLNRQQHLNWRHIRNQPLLFSFSSVVLLFWLWNIRSN